jgi:phosphomannomutase
MVESLRLGEGNLSLGATQTGGMTTAAEGAAAGAGAGMVLRHYEWLCNKYGHFVARNHYGKCYDKAVTAAIFERLRNNGDYWKSIGGSSGDDFSGGKFAIASVRDLTTGFDSAQPDGVALMPSAAGSEMITYTFENGCVTTLRTSGTEPKIKYVQIHACLPLLAKSLF